MKIYGPPEADLSIGKKRDPCLIKTILCSLFSFFAGYCYWHISSKIPQFSETFSSFGAELPLLTRSILFIHPVFLVMIYISIAFNIIWIVRVFSAKWALRIVRWSKYNLFLSITFFLVSMVAMYLPVFRLGQVT